MGMKNIIGFTLLEILLTLSILTILLMLNIPNLTSLFNKSEARLTQQKILHAIHLAHSEAFLQDNMITICKSSDHKSCAGNWNDGLIITKNQTPLTYVDLKLTHGTLHWRSSQGKEYLQILPNGMTTGENGTFWFCEKNKKIPSWAIRINQAGRARVEENKIIGVFC